MDSHESPNVPFTIMFERFLKGIKVQCERIPSFEGCT